MANLSQLMRVMATPPGIAIPEQVAYNMIDGYRIAHQANPGYTIYSDFGYEKFSDFMSFFPHADGIRIYNATTATGSNCFLFVPIRNVSTEGSPCWVECNPFEVDVNGDGEPDTNIAAFNFGTLCPPAGNCNCACDGVNGNRRSFAKQIYGNVICPPAPQP
ncbi:MAG: hypothetical protein MUC87_14450 [Bacteroidia bacterium]|nr:hypothetical protein [Bacteroidia bacterium]